MELRRVAEALVRSHTSPLATFLAPTATLRWNSHRQLRSRITGNRSTGRQFSVTLDKNVDWSPVTTSAAPSPKKEPISSSTTPAGEMDLGGLVSSLGWGAPKKQPAQSLSAELSESERNMKKGGTSAADLLAAMSSSPTPNSRFSLATSRGGKADFGRMRTDVGGQQPAPIAFSSYLIPESPKRALMKLGPSTGRSVDIGGGSVDIGRGFQLLNMSCNRNKVARDLSRQRFHERPGMKRKRLKSERWRKKFKAGFVAAVKRVKELHKQGW